MSPGWDNGIRLRLRCLRFGSSQALEVIDVSYIPGAIELTLIPYSAHSKAKELVSILTAVLLAAYTPWSVDAFDAAIELILIILPYFLCILGLDSSAWVVGENSETYRETLA